MAGGRQAYHHERDGHRMGMHAVARGPAGGVGSAWTGWRDRL